jgi:hypothetical protein
VAHLDRGVTKPRKRVSPPNDYDRFWDLAHARDYGVLVVRWIEPDGAVLLQVIAVKGGHELSAPSVTDVSKLAESVVDLTEQIQREAA